MSVLPRARRPTGMAGGTVLTPGIAGDTATSAPAASAEVRGILPLVNRHAALSWGVNDSGQLGIGDTDTGSRSLPGAVSGLGSGVVQVSAGGRFGLALTSDGTVRAWGDNTYGQLGEVDNSNTPARVRGVTAVIHVAAGRDHCLALRSNGTVWAWGHNETGELGYGGISIGELMPIEVKRLTGVTKIAAGDGFSLALRSDGTVWAWGSNYEGQLGNGTTTDSSLPVQVKGLSQVTSIAAGDSHALAVRANSITALTSVWAWGGGAFGDGAAHLPGLVTGITAPSIAGIAAGTGYSEALGSDGSVWGWGAAGFGQLGFNPGLNPVNNPVETIGAGSPVTQLSAGLGHTLALQSNGTVLAWGANSSGQLGNGVTSGSPTPPVPVTRLTGATQVSAGQEFSLAVYLPPQYR
jgi:alpha-tubulin suppressor-like RCC1 family protein